MVVFLIKNIFFAGFISLAQIMQPLNGVDPGPDPGFPITGGIMLLIAAAFGIGIKTFSKKNKH